MTGPKAEPIVIPEYVDAVTAGQQARDRFFTAAEGNPPTIEQRALVTELTLQVRQLASKIIRQVPDGRNKSLALTALEDVQMRANRAIFEPK
ncbi:hypothetical protein [Leifsonia sp. TF02-11]|uniref:Acb2/Tad1 domain-containing protein n=1 Tax=Leifsonia sp. TF02-11 TaxID=2815212 RepID=UPI001AA1AE43|nr:hypothetical protein [Leifsonia sp. TF02-11]MBO1739678.1 hypothetical protein [Leifsonia sp. TF02-11]